MFCRIAAARRPTPCWCPKFDRVVPANQARLCGCRRALAVQYQMPCCYPLCPRTWLLSLPSERFLKRKV